MPVKQVEKIHGAAAIFAFITRDAQEIGNYFKVTDRTIHRWAETPEWATALNVFGYDATRTFVVKPTRDTERDAGDDFQNARKVYLKALNAGEPRHKLAAITEAKTGIPRKKVGTWARKHGWRNTK